ncbi:MAG TPA: flagellar export chaperone FliS [Steroidobacteraceae bacterium]|nr:flagellar export chaperone FliS [Steroidobacteraceae bacterium]
MNPGAQQALKNYQTVGAHTQVASADPYKLVSLLLANVLERLAVARGHMERREIARKGEQISKAIAVISALDASLNFELGGEIAQNLHSLYEYMCLRLVNANLNDELAGLDEVSTLTRTIKDGWDGIAGTPRPPVAAPSAAVPAP